MFLENKSRARFKMSKERHKKSFEKALSEGKMDNQMISLCNYIAGTKNFFTSSGCAGRIVLLKLNENEEKRKSAFCKKWHCTVSAKEIIGAINSSKEKNLWFKQEPFIVHIGTNNLKNANKILETMHAAGIRRGGISVAKEGKFLIELIGSNFLSFPAKVGGKKIADREFIEKMVEIANKKLEKNYRALKRFEEECRKRLK